MSMPIEPMDNYIVAQAEVAKSKSPNGIILPDSAQEKPMTSKVLAVGKDVKRVKVGDKILYRKSFDSPSFDFKVESEEYIIIKEDDIVATVK